MNCDEFVELATARASAEEDGLRFVTHLAECSGRETHLDQFRLTIATVAELTGDDISPAARRQLLTAFREWKQR